MPPLRSSFAILIILLSWTAIYLPWLSKREVYGEEARRVLPGRTMLQTGEWMVPRSGGEIYNRKPPLVNWMSAAAISVTGRMDEFTVRFPSTLMILIMALSVFVFTRVWLGNDLALLAALIALTSKAMIDKGRMIEIEALYVALFGIAMSAWLGLRWREKPLAAWMVSGLVLGLGFLAKGPPHLIYFYACVIGVLAAEKKVSELWNWKHAAGLLCFFAVWVPWAMANGARNVQRDSAKVWTQQITQRLGFSEFKLLDYLLQIPMSLADFLPWVLLLRLLWLVDHGTDRHGQWMRGLRKGMTWAYFAIILLPSSRPRFLLPLEIVAAILIAGSLCRMKGDSFARLAKHWRIGVIGIGGLAVMALIAASFVRGSTNTAWSPMHWSLWALCCAASIIWLRVLAKQNWTQPASLGLHTACLMALIMVTLGFHFITRDPWRNELRNFSASITARTGRTDPVLLYKVGEHLWPFYLGMRCREIVTLKERPHGIDFRWLILPTKYWEKPAEQQALEERFGKVMETTPLTDPNGREHYVLVHTSGR